MPVAPKRTLSIGATWDLAGTSGPHACRQLTLNLGGGHPMAKIVRVDQIERGANADLRAQDQGGTPIVNVCIDPGNEPKKAVAPARHFAPRLGAAVSLIHVIEPAVHEAGLAIPCCAAFGSGWSTRPPSPASCNRKERYQLSWLLVKELEAIQRLDQKAKRLWRPAGAGAARRRTGRGRNRSRRRNLPG